MELTALILGKAGPRSLSRMTAAIRNGAPPSWSPNLNLPSRIGFLLCHHRVSVSEGTGMTTMLPLKNILSHEVLLPAGRDSLNLVSPARGGRSAAGR